MTGSRTTKGHDMTESEEVEYERGRRAGLMAVVRAALVDLGPDPNCEAERLALERAEAVAQLRIICDRCGDNEWPDELHLGDVIEKHLGRHLNAN